MDFKGIKDHKNMQVAVFECDKDSIFSAGESLVARSLGLARRVVDSGAYDLLHAQVDPAVAEDLNDALKQEDEAKIERIVKNEVVETSTGRRGQEHIMRTEGYLLDTSGVCSRVELSNDPNDIGVRVVYERTRPEPGQS